MHASLASIGRIQPIELEDPPDLDMDSEEERLQEMFRPAPVPLSELSHFLSECENAFFSYDNGRHVVAHTVTGMRCSHNEDYARFCHDLRRIHHLEDALQSLELQHNICLRLQDFEDFAYQIELLVFQELQLLETCNVDGTPGAGNSNLGYLRNLCETLRLNLNQPWTLCNLVQQNNTLQRKLYSSGVRNMLTEFLQRHHQLASRCVSLTSELIHAGLLVLSHSDLTRYTNDDLWEISRGIEEFNIILSHIQQQCCRKVLRQICVDNEEVFAFSQAEACIHRVDQMRAISFNKILQQLASERSLQVVSGIYRFLFIQPDVLHNIKRRGMNSIDWGEMMTTTTTTTGRESALSTDRDSGVSGSDHAGFTHNSSGRSSRSRQSGSSGATGTAASGASSKLDNIVNQLRAAGSPMNDYLKMEYEFASGFLDIISRSTEMLKNLQHPRRAFIQKEETFDSNFLAPLPVLGGGGGGGGGGSGNNGGADGGNHEGDSANNKSGEAPIGQKSARKGVQWSDHKEVSVRHHVIGRYLDLVWREVDIRLDHLFVSHVFTSNKADAKEAIGSIALFSPAALIFLHQLISKSAVTDLFTQTFLPTLRRQSLKMRLRACLTAWDSGVSRSNAYFFVSSLMHIQLDADHYCSRFCKSLLDAIDPLVHLVESLTSNIIETAQAMSEEKLSKNHNSSSSTNHTSSQMTSQLETFIVVIAQCMANGLASGKIALNWIRNRGELYASGDKLAELQFLIFTDATLLWRQCDCLLTSVAHLVNISPSSGHVSTLLYRLWPNMQTQVNLLAKITSNLHSYKNQLIQKFRSSCYQRTLAILNKEMPRQIKIWKAKTLSNLLQDGQRDSTVMSKVPIISSSSGSSKINSARSSILEPLDSSTQPNSSLKVTVAPLTYVQILTDYGLDDLLHPNVKLDGGDNGDKGSNAQFRAMIQPVVEEFCSAWHNFVLRDLKVKFSYWGACQLHSDVQYFREYLEQNIKNDSIMTQLLSSTAYTYLEAGIFLLKKQTFKRSSSSSISPGVSSDGRKSNASSSTPSSSCSGSCLEPDVGNDNTSMQLDVEDFHFHPHLKEWLALRAYPEEGRRFRPFCRG